MTSSQTQPRRPHAARYPCLALAAACGLAVPAPHAAAQLTEPFPAVFDLQTLLPAGGGDGSLGFVAEGGEGYDLMGFSVSSAGDINGDGIDDALLGAPGYSLFSYSPSYPYGYWAYPPIAGRAYIIFGRDSSTGAGFPASVDVGAMVAGDGVVLEGELNDYAGSAVAPLGDLNGDGVDDVAVGAEKTRRCYVVFGHDGAGGAGLPLNIDLAALDGDNGFVLFGRSSSHEGIGEAIGATDLNGDGLGDLLIGACCVSDGSSTGPGQVLVHFGRDTSSRPGFPAAASAHLAGLRIVGVAQGDATGAAVAGAGDVNADGVEDMIIGATRADPGGRRDAGSSFVVFGRAGGGFGVELSLRDLDGLNGFRLNGARERDRAGQSVASAGDLNGDGINDVVIGAPYSGFATPGRAYVVFGRDSTMGETFPAAMELADLDGVSGFRIEGVAERDFVGEHVAPAGDVNSDGIDDLLVAGHGRAFMVYGRDTASGPGFPAVLELADLDGSQGFALTGRGMWGVGGAGDLNRDGASDFIIGSPSIEFSGQSYIVFGRMPDFCYADCDGSGSLDFFDFLCFQNQFAAGDPRADCDESGELDFFDFLCFQNAFAAGCP